MILAPAISGRHESVTPNALWNSIIYNLSTFRSLTACCLVRLEISSCLGMSKYFSGKGGSVSPPPQNNWPIWSTDMLSYLPLSSSILNSSWFTLPDTYSSAPRMHISEQLRDAQTCINSGICVYPHFIRCLIVAGGSWRIPCWDWH